METSVIVLSLVVALFGVVSAVLGFIAEAKKLTPHDIHISSRECVYPANPAFALGLCAVLVLAVGQIIASVAGGCCGCCRPRARSASGSKRVIAIVCSVLSWVAAVVAGASFLQAAAWNAPMTRGAAEGRCLYPKGGVFTRAAVLSLVAAALGIMSYIMLTRAPAPAPLTVPGAAEPKKPDGKDPPAAGVAVGLSQWPAQGQEHKQV